MNKKALPIGFSNFKRIISDDYYYVDKTLLIKEFLELENKVTLITRPRLFGKSLNISMIAEFFDITKDSKALFQGTKIMDTPYAKEINQWPTIFISFSNARSDPYTITFAIKSQIRKIWSNYSFIFENLTEHEQVKHDMILNELMQLSDNKFSDSINGIVFLMDQMEKYYGKKVMLFIDGYDTPFIEAHLNNCYEQVKIELSKLFYNVLENTTSLKYAMLIGVQQIAREDIFSKLTKLAIYDVSDHHYSTCFGFTKDETKAFLEYYGLELNNEVKEMYNGYKIGKNRIYNPWTILNYIDTKEFRAYWINTSSNIILQKVIENADKNFNDGYEKLISKGYLETKVDLQTSFYEVPNKDRLWGLFINAGYLTVTKKINNKRYRIEIPNRELRTVFINLTNFYLSFNGNQIGRLMRFLTHKKKEDFIEQYQYMITLPEYSNLKNKKSYHMMYLGLSVCLSDQYYIKREKEKGIPIIIIKAKDSNNPSYVFNFKYIKKKKIKDGELDFLAYKAIKQIKNNKYAHKLKGEVIYIGIAQHGKDVSIKWKERI